jgi:hypothetical protein
MGKERRINKIKQKMKELESKLNAVIATIELTEPKAGLNTLKEIKEEVSNLIEMLKSDSVHTALRHAYKNPCNTGMDECKDNLYQDLYEISKELKYGK